MLFAAVRSNVINAELFQKNNTANWDLWQSNCELDGSILSYSFARQLDSYSVTFISLATELKGEHYAEPSEAKQLVRANLVRLLSLLAAWMNQIPPGWLPQKLSYFQHLYPSEEVAYLFCEYYLLRLKIWHVIHRLDSSGDALDTALDYHLASVPELLHNVMASEYSFIKASDLSNVDREAKRASEGTKIPQVTNEKCRASVNRASLFDEILARLEDDLSDALLTFESAIGYRCSVLSVFSLVEEGRANNRRSI